VATLCASGLASFSQAPASLECSVQDSLADWLGVLVFPFTSLQILMDVRKLTDIKIPLVILPLINNNLGHENTIQHLKADTNVNCV
jgi:hypothetical protein